MMKNTRVNALLGTQYAILQGGMLWIATAELAGTVSNAGGLGVVSPLAGMQKHGDPSVNLTHQLGKISRLTNKPFGLNIPLDLPYTDKLIEVAIQHEVGIVITAAGSPQRYSDRLKSRGCILIHVVSTVKQAMKAASCGVDAVVAEGVEAAAHNGINELPLFALIPQIVDAVPIPVIAAGGIADARGVVAALALGAEGVQMGTRFVAVDENSAHLNYKMAIVNAEDTHTLLTGRGTHPSRSLKTDFTNAILELEKSGATEETIREFIGYRSNRDAQMDGNLNAGEAYCGAAAGLIKEILPVQVVIDRLVAECQTVLKRLPQ